MINEEALLSIAEIAIAVIGFAGIVSALRPQSSPAADAMHSLRIRIMVEASASVMVFAFLPFVLSGAFDVERIWAIGSGAIAVTAPPHIYSVWARQRRLFGTALLRETLLFDSFVMFLATLVEALLIVNCLGWLFESRFGVYLLGVLLPLGVVVAMFIRAIFAAEAE